LTSILKDNKQELEFLKEHGSNNQLFLTLRKQITIIQKTDKKIHDMIFSTDVNVVLYSSDTPTPSSYVYLVVLCIVSSVDKLYGGLHWKSNYCYDLTDMAVTSDNKLLLCNYQSSRVDIYKDYKTYEDEISLICDNDPIV
jgi:hypothetical protein